VVFVIAIVALAAYGIILVVAHYAVDFASAVPELYKEARINVSNWWSDVSRDLPAGISKKISDTADSAGDEISAYLASKVTKGYLSGFAKGVTNGLIGIIVMFMSSYFFMVDWDKLHKNYASIESDRIKEQTKLIKDNLLVGVGGYIYAQVKLMGIVAIMLFIGLTILPSKYAFVPAILIAVLDAIPFLGVGTVLIPWAIYEFTLYKFGYAVGLLALYLICMVSRQILQARFVGDSVGLSPLTTLILMYIGLKLGGIIGFILMILMGIIVKKMYESGFFDGSINRMKNRIQMLKEAP
jgi:sporulation integral membrane protein YtvI